MKIVKDDVFVLFNVSLFISIYVSETSLDTVMSKRVCFFKLLAGTLNLHTK